MAASETRRALEAASEAVAFGGGLVLCAGALFAVVAIGADAGGRPILGDTEVVELVAAGAVASFLPLAQMRDAHVSIGVFTDRLPAPVLRGLDAIARLAFAVVASVLAWRLCVGGLDAFERERTSMFLGLPLWWGYLLAAPSVAFWVVTSWFLAAEALIRRPPAAPEREP